MPDKMTEDEEFRRGIEAIMAEYRQGLAQRVGELVGLAHDLACGVAAPDRMHELLRGLHSLAGTGRTFGLPEVSVSAAMAESFLEPYCAAGIMSADEWIKFGELLNALKRSAAG